MERGRPWLRLKAAISLDGRSALADGASQWITGEAARTDGHAWRKRAGAVLTGVGTVREDDPRLDVRLVPTRAPTAARRRRLAPRDAARRTHPRRRPARCSSMPPSTIASGAPRSKTRGAEIAVLPSPSRQGRPRRDARRARPARHQRTARRSGREAECARSLASGLVDELLVYVAPRLLGSGRALAALGPIAGLEQALGFSFSAVERVGDDLRLLLRPARVGPATNAG